MSSLEGEIARFRIPLEDILTATDYYSEKKKLNRGRTAVVYKGILLLYNLKIDVVVIRQHSCDILKFHEQIKRISSLVHRNVVPFIGFCDQRDERIIVMEHVVNGSLHQHLSNSTLTCSQTLHICFGAALAVKNAYGTKIRSFKILLDKNHEAKVLFRLDTYRYETENYDALCSFGLILLRVLYGKKPTIEDVIQYQDDMIDPNLRKQMVKQSLSIFSKVAYNCFKEQQPDDQQSRYMCDIVGRLKEAFEIQWAYENSKRMEKFAYLKIPLIHVKLATNNFASTYNINPNIYYQVYRADLDLIIRNRVRKKKVFIMRMDKHKLTTKDLFAEIELHTSCKHKNLFSFHGYCNEDSEMVLVFECDFKESFSYYLSSVTSPTLTWEQRLQICIDIANLMKDIHKMEEKSSMLHEIIMSTNVFLDDKWTPKIANFKLYEFDIKATPLWQSRPENFRTWLLEERVVVDDIYSLGIIIFEILTGKPAYQIYYIDEKIYKRTMLASLGLGLINEKDLNSIADYRIREEAQHSLGVVDQITYQCLTPENPSERPTFEVVVKSLEKALHIQNATLQLKKLGHLPIPLKDIKLATKTFDRSCLIGSGGYGEVYKGELKIKSQDEHFDTPKRVAIKRITTRRDGQDNDTFFAELDVACKCNHLNIISFLGFCVEDGEMLLVYELASNGSLENYLEEKDTGINLINLTWAQRLQLCIGIAQGLKYMHTTMGGKERILHRDIKSANILLSEKWEAKIADFGLSKVYYEIQGVSTINTNNIVGTNFYRDPEYVRTGRLKKASDVYSLGVVLFEIFSGKLAYDPIYIKENEKGIAAVARRHFKKGIIKNLLDPKTMDEVYELGFTGKVEPDHDSLDVFARIAYQCLSKTQVERPTIKDVIEELDKALHLQENRIKTLQISLEHIRLGVDYFNVENRIMKTDYGVLYKGKIKYNDRHKKVVVKKFFLDKHLENTSFSCEHGFLKEFELLLKYKHENIIGLVGYCKEMEENIIVFENASKGSLDMYLTDTSLSWTKRLMISVDIANGLKFLHGGVFGQDVVIHRDIKSSSILLTKDFKAKICGFELALTYPTTNDIEHVVNNVEGSRGYIDPSFLETHFLRKESDIYSFGVILFELLCGRLACLDSINDHTQFLDVLVKHQFQEVPHEEMVFEGIKEQIGQESLATYREIAFQCLHDDRKKRPTADDVLVQLQRALKYQEDYEKVKAKLDRNPQENSAMAKKDIYSILSKGLLLEHDKLEIVKFLKQQTWKALTIDDSDSD